jgi:hypothetical protein
MSTPWLFESALVGLVLALQYSTLKERMPDATATLVEAASIFFLVMTTNVLIRQSLLVLLLSSGHSGIVEDSLIRLALLFFPSTRPASQAAESVSTALFAARASTNESPPPPAIKRSYTTGGGALGESVTTEELPAVSGEEEFDTVKTFKSVLFIDGQHAARVALPPVSACLLVASNIWLAAATSNIWLGDRLGVKAVLPVDAAPWPMLQVGVIFRLLIPFDVALLAVIGDLVVANNVSNGVRPGFYYLAVALRCILWSLSLTGTLRLLGITSGGGGVFTAYGLFGVGLTLSLQQTAKDLLSTLQLFLTRPYDVGDEIDAGNGHHGWVINVGWRFTTL